MSWERKMEQYLKGKVLDGLRVLEEVQLLYTVILIGKPGDFSALATYTVGSSWGKAS